jgi:hypothetical protein
MGKLGRALEWIVPLTSGIGRIVGAASLAVGTGAAVAVWLMTGSLVSALAVGIAGVFAAMAAAVVGVVGGMLLHEVRGVGVAALALALCWLAHPAALLALPSWLAPLLAPISIAASLLLGRFAGGVAEAAARP